MERTNGFLIVIRYRHCCASPGARNRGCMCTVIELKDIDLALQNFMEGKEKQEFV